MDVDLHEGVKNIMKYVTQMRIIPSPQIHVRNELRGVIVLLDFVEILQNYLEFFRFKSNASYLWSIGYGHSVRILHGAVIRPSQRRNPYLLLYEGLYTNCTVFYINFSCYFIIRNFENFRVKLNKPDWPDFVRKLADAEIIFSHASQDCYRMHHFHQLKTHMTPFEWLNQYYIAHIRDPRAGAKLRRSQSWSWKSLE